MSTKGFEPAAVLALTEYEQIRAYVHPTRMTILGILGREPLTGTGVARELGVHPANLTRHLRLLERTGLIRLVERRDAGRVQEKYYRSAALAFEVRTHAQRPEDRTATVLGVLRDNLSGAVAATRTAPAREVLGLLERARIAPADLPRLSQRLQEVVQEFTAMDVGEGEPYHLAVALYPADGPAIERFTAEVSISSRPDGKEGKA